MKYVISLSDTLTLHRDLPFIPLHYTYLLFTSHFTSLPFLMISPRLSRRLIYHLNYLVCRRQSLKHLQVVGLRSGWSYVQRNIADMSTIRRDTSA
jgi:hypothetical protein